MAKNRCYISRPITGVDKYLETFFVEAYTRMRGCTTKVARKVYKATGDDLGRWQTVASQARR